MRRHWALIESDLQDIGVDVGDRELMSDRSWRWLRTRILGLIDSPVSVDSAGNPVFSNRVQAVVLAPAIDQSKRAQR
jgi:hypothetical protein